MIRKVWEIIKRLSIADKRLNYLGNFFFKKRFCSAPAVVSVNVSWFIGDGRWNSNAVLF